MAQIKKVYISVDFEGMEGVVTSMSCSRGQMDYQAARKRLTLDVNAAVQACIDFGAEEVVICDGHADMENLLVDELHEEAKLISGAMRNSLQMEGIERGFDACIMFGHAGAGLNVDGVINHCYNGGKIYNMRLNGITMNTEIVQNSVVAGCYGIPTIAVIGDDALAREVREFIPNVEAIVVKQGITRFSALSISPAKARRLIYEGVTRALHNTPNVKPLVLSQPITMEIDYKETNMADTASLVPGVVRLSPRSVSFTADHETLFKVHELLVFRLVDKH